MNITHIKNINNQSKIIFLTSNNSTPTKLKRISFSNSLTTNKNKIKYHNKRKINKFEDSITNKNFSYNVYNDNQKYIFNCYKISPIIALLIYEKSINKLLEFIKKRLPKNNFIEIKKKYISFVIEELNIKSKNILHNISEPDLINLNVKLFTSNNNNNNTNCYSGNFNKLIYNPKPQYKPSCNSNSLFQLNKNRIKRGKLLSYNSFNTDLKRQNNSLVNSSNILFHPKKSKNIFHTEYNQKINNNSNRNSITNLKQKKDKINHFKNISMSNGNLLIKNNFFENNKKYKLKEKIINKDNEIAKIFKKMPSNKRKNINNSKNASSSIESKKLKNEDDSDNIEVNIINNNNNNELNKIKDYKKKKSLQQLNLIKENLEDNLKNMLNFSYGYYLNYEKESESSKSQYDFNKI